MNSMPTIASVAAPGTSAIDLHMATLDRPRLDGHNKGGLPKAVGARFGQESRYGGCEQP
jgi:hypothetical protein